MVDFAYVGEFVLKDDSIVRTDLERQGWATKELISNIKTFTLVPKEVGKWPLLRIHIPDKAKPVWTWRVFRKMAQGGDGEILQEMRIYGIGYKKRGQKPHMMWVVPGGHVEAGLDVDSPAFAQVLWHGPPKT